MKLALSALFTLVLSARVCISTPVAQADPTPDAAAPGWQFKVVGNSGVLALESIVVSPTLVIFFDRSSNDTLQINGHSAWGALWDLQTNTPRALNLVTDTFCASGALLSNGTMVSVGGMHVETPEDGDLDGRMSIRLFEPCADAAGIGCTIIENPETLHLAKQRWYPSSVRIPDGSLMIIGGIDDETPFYNNVTDSVNSFEFFPSKDGGVPRPSPFLERSLPANLFPRAFVLPDGKVFIVANNQSIIYDIQTKTETRLPDIPNGVRVTNPFDGTGALLPLSPPDYTPEVLICGGTNISDATPPLQISSQTPASNQCSRIKLTPEGIAKGWEVEHMFEGRMMPEMILMPNGQVLITNGAQTGTAAIGSVGDPVDGSSNADHPALTPSLYTPNAPLGQRISNKGLPTATIPRMYHSSVTLTGQGNILLAGSNPNNVITNQGKFPSELRVELLNPPFMFVPRPQIVSVPKRLGFGRSISVPVNIPSNLAGSNNIQVALIDLGFSSHAWHSSARLVFLEAQLSSNKRTLTVTAPPNPNIFPPGPGWLFLTINDVTSPGQMIMVGSGTSPPQTAAEAML